MRHELDIIADALVQVGSFKLRAPIPYAEVFVYARGTSDEVDVFPTGVGGAPLSQPLKADWAGRVHGFVDYAPLAVVYEDFGGHEYRRPYEAGIGGEPGGGGDLPQSADDGLPVEEPFFLTSPQGVVIRDGLFTPESDSVRFRVRVGAAVTGLAKAALALYVGPPGSETTNYDLPRLTPDKEYNVGGTLADGVQKFPLGALNPHSMPWPIIDHVLPTPADSLAEEVLVEGLTPGVEYKWEVSAAIVGAAGGYALGTDPGNFAVSKVPGRGGFLRVLVHCPVQATARVLLLGQVPGNIYEHEIFGLSVAPGANCAVAVNGPGNAGVITNRDADGYAALQVVNMWTGEMSPHAIKAGESGAAGVDISPDGLIAFVTAIDSDKLLRFSFFTQDWEVTEYAVGDQPLGVGVSPDWDYVAVANYGDGSLSLVTVAGGAVASHNLPSPFEGDAGAVAWAPDSSEVWVVALDGSDTHIVPFNIGDDDWDTDRALTINVAGLGYPSFQPDGKNLFLFKAGSPQVYQYEIHADRPPTPYLTWPTGGTCVAGACGINGQIFATAKDVSGADYFMQWWGSRMRIRDEGVGEFFEVTIEGIEP